MYLKRLSVIWTSPLSDYNKTVATVQFALPELTYFMQMQVCQIAELQRIKRKTPKIMVANGAKHPQGSTELLLYLSRVQGREGLSQ